MKRYLILLLSFFTLGVYAQQVKLTGNAVAASDKQPMIGLTVLVKGTTNGTVTDLDGNYMLNNVAKDATIVFSMIGYKTQEIKVNGRTVINVVMSDDTQALDEVVVIGYGAVKKSDLTSSIAAIKDGKCIDTSMGLTPLEGLVMGTRSGDIDAGAVTFIMEKEGLNATGVSNLLNKKSGVLGVSGVSSDMRELEAAVAAGNPKAILAEKMYFYRIKKYIGAYAAALGGVDIILFTGGVGENQANCRSEVCEGLEFMGVKIDLEKNKVRGEEAIISADDSKVTVAVIPTDEELMIASDTLAILNK